jgi:chemotaxis protein MotB
MAGKGGGGAWKVAYADFVTAMMAFFMVMWITAQGKPVKDAVAQYFRDPTGSSAAKDGASSTSPSEKTGLAPPSDQIMPVGSPVAMPGPEPGGGKKGKGKGDGTKKQLVARPREGELMLGTSVVLAEGSAELTEAAKDQLKKIVPNIIGKRNKIEIRSHSTRRPLPPGSPYRDAWHLCYERALAVMKYLESQGIEPDRFRPSQAGPFEPAYTLGIDPVKQAANSRVEIYQLGVLVEDLTGSKAEREQRFQEPGQTP